MYQFSRAVYRELSPMVVEDNMSVEARRDLLDACERAFDRLANDRHYFARPSRTLFNDIRAYFPMSAQVHVYRVVDRYMSFASDYLAERPAVVMELTGRKLECRATTRKGTPCQRMPLAHNGYCPSHQHLAETEEVLAAA